MNSEIDSQGPGLPILSSLRGKGWIFTFALGVYFLLVTAIVAYERQSMQESVNLLQDLNAREERLVALNYAVSRTVVAVNENYFSPDIESSGRLLALEVEALIPGLTRLQAAYPILSGARQTLAQAVDELSTLPSRATVAELRGAIHRLVIELDMVTADVASKKAQIVSLYQASSVRLTAEWITLGSLALVLMAVGGKAFLRGLVLDIERVRLHAAKIVKGEPAPKLIHQRKDELGLLMDAINTMQDELVKRETEIELSRQQGFHKEKMAAIGSLASAVAHEINNPLSAIVGVAQAIDHECQSQDCALYGSVCHPEMILDQAKRVMHITRQISEFSVPQSQEPELIDINGLLKSTANFVKFDRRFRMVDVVLDLDSQLPAIHAVADHLVQVAMNLLINAADALQGKTGGAPRIEVKSYASGSHVELKISDNGHGISPEILPRVFEERFSTKGVGRGSGLGLSLCRSLVTKFGGDIHISSEVGVGTVVLVTLPVPVLGGDCR